MRRWLVRWLLLDVAMVALLLIGGGDPSTCAHQSVRADGPVAW